MLITKTPFRISFCGGGSDIEDFYKEHGGCVLSTSINKYMYLSIHPYFDEKQTLLKYSENELVSDIRMIRHKIFHRVLCDMGVSGVEISSTADVPGGTGLGSSSTFTVGLLHTLYCYKGKFVSKERLAKEACEVEIEKLGAPIGKQDQYAAALGGLNFIRFHQDGFVSASPVLMKAEAYHRLEQNLLLFYTGTVRSANEILSEQKKNITQADKNENLRKMCGLAQEMKEALEQNDLSHFGSILHESWELKKTLAGGISNPKIDEAYARAMQSGALGGKLLGAGGGGFLLFYCEPQHQEALRRSLGLKEFAFQFERDGSSLVYIGDKYWR